MGMLLQKNYWVGAVLLLLPLVLILAVFSQAEQLALLPGIKLGDSKVTYINDEHKFPRQIIDPIGRVIKLAEPPQAIISGILAGDEMLTRLVDHDRIRSVTYLADDPGVSNVSGDYSSSIIRNHGAIEEFIAAEPDLAIVAAYSNATSVEMLLATGIPIIRFPNSYTYENIRSNVRTLAKALGAEQRGEQWLMEMDRSIALIQRQVAGQPKPRVLYYSLSGSTSGPGSLMDETINLAGGSNVIAETGLKGYTRISSEMAISLLPDVILLNDWSAKNKSAKEILLADPAWRDAPAIKNQRVYSLRGAWLTSGSPYRVKGIKAVARLLHPEQFVAETPASTKLAELASRATL